MHPDESVVTSFAALAFSAENKTVEACSVLRFSAEDRHIYDVG